MKVVVIVPKWGTYKEGDEIDMPESTARACILKGVVEDPDAEDDLQDDDDFDPEFTGDQEDDLQDDTEGSEEGEESDHSTGEPDVIGTGSVSIETEEPTGDQSPDADEPAVEQSADNASIEESTEVKPKKKK